MSARAGLKCTWRICKWELVASSKCKLASVAAAVAAFGCSRKPKAKSPSRLAEGSLPKANNKWPPTSARACRVAAAAATRREQVRRESRAAAIRALCFRGATAAEREAETATATTTIVCSCVSCLGSTEARRRCKRTRSSAMRLLVGQIGASWKRARGGRSARRRSARSATCCVLSGRGAKPQQASGMQPARDGNESGALRRQCNAPAKLGCSSSRRRKWHDEWRPLALARSLARNCVSRFAKRNAKMRDQARLSRRVAPERLNETAAAAAQLPPLPLAAGGRRRPASSWRAASQLARQLASCEAVVTAPPLRG